MRHQSIHFDTDYNRQRWKSKKAMEYTALLRDLRAVGDEEMAALLHQEMQIAHDTATFLNVTGSRKPLTMPPEKQERPKSASVVTTNKRRPLSPTRPCWVPPSPGAWKPPASTKTETVELLQETLDAFSAAQGRYVMSSADIPVAVHRMFQKYDINGDSRLSLEEFSNALLEEGVPRYIASIIFFMNDQNYDGRIDKYELAAMYECAPKPFTSTSQAVPTLQGIAAQVAGEELFLHQLTFVASQTGGSHLGAFFRDASGNMLYVKFPGLSSVCNDDAKSQRAFNDLLMNSNYAEGTSTTQSLNQRIQSMSEVLVSKLYGMVGVNAACVRFVFIKGSDFIGLWSRVVEYDDIGIEEMLDLPDLRDGFAADAWLANWDVIGNGSPAELNMKRTKYGRAFRLDFGGCLQYRATGGDKADVGTPFTADAVPETVNLRQYNQVFLDVADSDIAAGVAKIVVGATDSAIRDVVESTLAVRCGNIADILIGRKNVLAREYSFQIATMPLPRPGDGNFTSSFSSSNKFQIMSQSSSPKRGDCEGLGRTISPSLLAQRIQGESHDSPSRGQILGPSPGILASRTPPNVGSPPRMERQAMEYVWGSGQALAKSSRASSPLRKNDGSFQQKRVPKSEVGSQPIWRPAGKTRCPSPSSRLQRSSIAGDDPFVGTTRAGGWQTLDSSRHCNLNKSNLQCSLHMTDAEGSPGVYVGPTSGGRATGIGKLRYDNDGSIFIGDFMNGHMLTGALFSQSGAPKSTMALGRWTRTLHSDILASFPWLADASFNNL